MKQEKNILYFRRLFFEIREICVSLLFINEKNQYTEIYEKVYCMCQFLFDTHMNAYNKDRYTCIKSVGSLNKKNVEKLSSYGDEISFINSALKKGYAFLDDAEFSYGELLLEPNFNANIWMNCNLFVNESADCETDIYYCINLFQEILDFLKKDNTSHLSFGIREILMKYYVLIRRYGAFVY